MGFGIRVSYHAAQQQANRRQPPVCPCASCFNGAGEEHGLRTACRSPAAALGLPRRLGNPFSGWRLGRIHGLGFGGLSRKRSMDTMASDLRPLDPGHPVLLGVEDVVVVEEEEEDQAEEAEEEE